MQIQPYYWLVLNDVKSPVGHDTEKGITCHYEPCAQQLVSHQGRPGHGVLGGVVWCVGFDVFYAWCNHFQQLILHWSICARLLNLFIQLEAPNMKWNVLNQTNFIRYGQEKKWRRIPYRWQGTIAARKRLDRSDFRRYAIRDIGRGSSWACICECRCVWAGCRGNTYSTDHGDWYK